MPSHHELAQLCKACYVAPAQFDRVVNTSGVWAGIKHYTVGPLTQSVIACRGSTTIQDWLRDAMTIPITDPQLGMVEQGFMLGIRDLFAHVVDEIKAPTPKSLFITGHSLGAAHALLLAGLLADYPVVNSVVTFGSPHPGGAKLKELLAKTPIFSYCNDFDPVCDVPLAIPELAPYMHPRELLHVKQLPAPDDPWGPVAQHHIEYYEEAVP